MLYTSDPIQQLPSAFDYTLQLLPVSPFFFLSFFLTPHLCLTSLIHLCSRLPTAKKLTYVTPLAPSLALCRLRITMKDKVLMISIQFSASGFSNKRPG